MNDRVDIDRLLRRFRVDAKRQGAELHALCPAHEDRSPSWSINVHTGAHHCFSCGWGGGVAKLVIRLLDAEKLSWTQRDAWEWLRTQGLLADTDELGLSVELYLADTRKRAMRLPANVRVEPVSTWPTPARRYIEQRQVHGWQLRRWSIGYCVDGRLANRIVFPVFASSGRLLSYSARTFVDAEPRYLTPHESESPDEAALFGEQHWPLHGQRDRVVVVEGAIKALAVERAASGYVAGLLGATQARNPRVAAKLATFSEVVVLTDSDAAGEAAATTLVASLARHARVRRATTPVPVDDAADGALRAAVA